MRSGDYGMDWHLLRGTCTNWPWVFISLCISQQGVKAQRHCKYGSDNPILLRIYEIITACGTFLQFHLARESIYLVIATH